MQQVTITGAVQTVAGSSATAAKLKVTLAGYGSSVPQIVNGEFLGGIVIQVAIAADGTFSFPVWGNDVISPGGTWYCVQVIDARGNCIAANNYQLVGQGTLQLTAILPFDPTLAQGILYVATLNNQGPAGLPGGVAGAFTGRVVPTGIIDGNNRVFTVPGNPTTLWLYKNGTKLDETTDYSFAYTSANLTTVTLAQAPGTSGPPDNKTDNLEFYGFTSAGLETTVSGLMAPALAAAAETAVTDAVGPIVTQQLADALRAQLPAAITSVLIALGIAPEPPSLAITGDDGVVYLIQSFYDQPRIVKAKPGTVGNAPSSYPILDADPTNGTTYLLTVGAYGAFNAPTPTTGIQGAPTFYTLADPNQNTNQLQVLRGQITLTLGS